ncbi:hypothetical protein NHH03_11300 [Stieleria sp. TO1_6]|uniref:hypothetical protein n=1 Tax=Stieleria tagensis TaxID=2956795 RepID=UPI00209B90F7|nr:hypothetical protein [Stieleria tagensis]MCO8122327.1 hypothetical protein [Stieleria tagensis]
MSSGFDSADLARCEDALRLAIEYGVWDTAITAKLRSMVGETAAALVLATAKLHPKAQQKLGPGIWWCTERSLQQSTARQVADLKAEWIAGAPVYDLCCGIGGDTVSIARATASSATPVVGVDLDPMMVAMATENLRLNLESDHSIDNRCELKCAAIESLGIPSQSSIQIDPDRRDDCGRKTRPQDYAPPWPIVQKSLEGCFAGLVKLAPAAEIDDHPDHHRVWISLSGSVREQSLLVARAIDQAGEVVSQALKPGSRSAIAIDHQGRPAVFSSDHPYHADSANGAFGGRSANDSVEWADKPLAWMVDPDAAIRAAGLTAEFATTNSLAALGGPAGFLTGPESARGDMAICEPVIWNGACDDRKLRKTLRSLDVYPVRIKTRGVAQNPNVLEKRYRDCGQHPVTLWIGKTARRQFAAITRPQDSAAACDERIVPNG